MKYPCEDCKLRAQYDKNETKGFSMIGYTNMDLGIAKYHFEIGAGKDNFEWV